jgi:protein-S-isoprenylcysteine O-methyltransferase Ste14
MTTWRLLKPILILPGTALVAIPALILWAADGTPFGAAAPSVRAPTLWLGLPAAVAAVVLMVWTMRLFIGHGRGTPAPWDPPERLVVLGPYRHVRNPMIAGVVLFLISEALVMGAPALFAWAAFFMLANMIYFPLSEEPALARRHGEAYRRYRENVPRWIPRLTPWRGPGDGEGDGEGEG